MGRGGVQAEEGVGMMTTQMTFLTTHSVSLDLEGQDQGVQGGQKDHQLPLQLLKFVIKLQ